MSVSLNRRIAALEASSCAGGRVIPIWCMKPDGEVMTDAEIEQEIAARKAAGAPPNGRFVPFRWLTDGE